MKKAPKKYSSNHIPSHFVALVTHPSPPINKQETEEEKLNFLGHISLEPSTFFLSPNDEDPLTSSSSPTSSSVPSHSISKEETSTESTLKTSADEIQENSYLTHLNKVQARDESKSRKNRRRRSRPSSKQVPSNRSSKRKPRPPKKS